jgi:prepilin-type processing-associated H-X9-DG protein
VIKGLGYDFETRDLFTGQTGLNQKKLRRTLAQVKQFQCAEDPIPKDLEDGPSNDNPDPHLNQVLDYISSAAPIPYDRQSFEQDLAGLGANPDQPRVQGLEVAGYTEVRKQDAVAAVTNPAALIYVTEGSVYLSDTEMRYHHFFVASQLPFSANARIARDQRHPGGLANLFFDGHAEMLQLNKLDPGWGESIGKRMKYITVPSAEITDAEWNG